MSPPRKGTLLEVYVVHKKNVSVRALPVRLFRIYDYTLSGRVCCVLTASYTAGKVLPFFVTY